MPSDTFSSHSLHPPILVTGAHRAGTTWVGRMLTAGGEAVYINEPLSRLHRPGVFAASVPYWYFYLCTENETPYLKPFHQTLTLRYGWLQEVRVLRSPKDLARMLRDGWRFFQGQQRRQRPLLKDPFAVFSVPWFVKRWGIQSVVLVRHPAAVISSWMRLRWVVSPQQLLAQSLLCEHLLTTEEIEALEQAQSQPKDLLERGALLWRIIYRIVDDYRAQGLAQVLRHEDLAQDPLTKFRDLYRTLNLHFTPQVRRAILRSSTGRAEETDPRHPHTVQLNSQAVARAWRQRLAPTEVARIRELTEPVASRFYTDEDWQ